MHTYCKFRYANRTVSVNTLDCSVFTDQLARHTISWVHSGWLTTQPTHTCIDVHLITAPMLVDGQLSTATAPHTPMHRSHNRSRSQPGSRQLAAKPIYILHACMPLECCVILDYSYQSKAN